MGYLDAAELTDMQADIELLMDETCAVLTPTESIDAQGNAAATWGTATVKCHVAAAGNASERVLAGQIFSPQAYTLTVPYNTAITTRCRVAYSGVTFEVTSVQDEGTWPTTVRATMVEAVN